MNAHKWKRRLPEPETVVRVARHPAVLIGAALVALFGVTRAVPLFRIPSIEAPRPAVAADEDWVPPLPLSTLSVPVTVDLSPVVAQLEGIVPRRHGSLEDRNRVGDNDRLEVAFELRRQPFQAELRGTTAHVRTTIHYRARTWYDPPVLPTVSASCATGEDEPAPRAVVELAARLSLSADWRLQSRPRIVAIGPATETDRDRCRLTVFNFDVTERIMSGARGLIETRIPEIRGALANIDLRSRFERWWDVLSTPVQLDEDVWLVVDPLAVAQGETSGSGQSLTATTVLTANPRLVLGPRPTVEARPLPSLAQAGAARGLTIRATATADYVTASARLNEQLAGQTLEQSGHTLEIEHLELFGIGQGKVALAVDIGGAARGRIYLVGSPDYDPAQGQVHVPDLEFDVATLNVLVGGLDWLAHDELVGFLRERARWPMEDLTALASTHLQRGLNARLSETVRLEGAVDSVRVLGIHPTKESLVVHAAANGRAELLVSH